MFRYTCLYLVVVTCICNDTLKHLNQKKFQIEGPCILADPKTRGQDLSSLFIQHPFKKTFRFK